MSGKESLETLEELFSRVHAEALEGSPPSEKSLSELADALEHLARDIQSKDLTISEEQFKTRIEALSLKATELEKKFLLQSEALESFLEKSIDSDEKKDVYKKPTKSS